MNSKFKKVIKNPVRLSPWESSAPKGFSHRTKRLRGNRLPPVSLPHPSNNYQAHLQRRIEFDRVLFKNLNKNLLTFTYPCISEKEIDSAMALCKNNLSETMKLLRRVMKDRGEAPEIPTPPCEESLAQRVKYIPTKYSDVQIVEPSKGTNIKMMEVNNDVLKILQTYEINSTTPTTSQDNTITLYRGDATYPNLVVPPKLPESHQNSGKLLKVKNETKYPDTLASNTVNQHIFWKGP